MAKKAKLDASGTGELVLSAIRKLMKNTGWTTRTLTKFIKLEYKVSDPKLSRKISRALKRGVKLGLLLMSHGRYRLNDHMVQVVKRISVNQVQRKSKAPQKVLRVRSRSPSPIRARS